MKRQFFGWMSALALLALLPACDDEFDFSPEGEAVRAFQIVSPPDGSVLSLNAATPDQEVVISWQEAQPGVDLPVSYQWEVALVDGTFEPPLAALPSDASGEATTLTVSMDAVDGLLAANGVGTGDAAALQWRVAATNGQYTRYSDTAFITIERFADEAVYPFGLLEPAHNIEVEINTVLDPDGSVTFTWADANTLSGSGEVSYELLFRDVNGSFNAPLYSVDAGTDTTITLSHPTLKDELGDEEVVAWAVRGSTGEVGTLSGENFLRLNVSEITTMNIIGDGANGWGEEDDVAMTNDGGGNFSAIVELNQDGQIKFRQHPGDWSVNWGAPEDIPDDPVLGEPYELVFNSQTNIPVPGSGGTASYLVEVDVVANTFTLSAFAPPSELYLVGGSSPAGWDPPSSLPFEQLEAGIFEIYSPLTVAGDGFKFLEIQDWPGDWGKDPASANGIIQEGEENVTVPEDAFYRVTVDFTTLTFETLRTDWGIIGSATPTGWDADTDMTQVEGTFDWTIDIQLSPGEFKFRANDDWPINFGPGAVEGELEAGSPNNFSVTEEGLYTVTMSLDPVEGYTYSVVKQ